MSKSHSHVLRGRMGGAATSATHSPQEMVAPARAGFLERFRREVDPDGMLPEAERERRANAALKKHMAALSLKAMQKRGKRPEPERAEVAG